MTIGDCWLARNSSFSLPLLVMQFHGALGLLVALMISPVLITSLLDYQFKEEQN